MLLIPHGGNPYPVAEVSLRGVAELVPGLADRVAVVGAEKRCAKARDRRTSSGWCHHRQAFGDIPGRVEGPVGDVEARRAGADVVGDRPEQLLLGSAGGHS